MNQTGVITCGGEEFQNWASDPRYEILSVETPKPGVYRFTPRLKSLPQTQCSTGETQSRPFPARAGKVMESAGQYKDQNVAGSGGLESRKSENASAESSQGQTNDATPLDLKDNLFGNASPPNPSGVARPQEPTPTPPSPAGKLSQRVELLPMEIPDFLLRARRMEISILGQMPHPDGRRTVFDYFDIKNAPQVNVERLQAIPERLVMTCQYCQGPLEEDGTCNICAVGDRIFAKSRANRKAYHEQKKAGL